MVVLKRIIYLSLESMIDRLSTLIIKHIESGVIEYLHHGEADEVVSHNLDTQLLEANFL